MRLTSLALRLVTRFVATTNHFPVSRGNMTASPLPPAAGQGRARRLHRRARPQFAFRRRPLARLQAEDLSSRLTPGADTRPREQGRRRGLVARSFSRFGIDGVPELDGGEQLVREPRSISNPQQVLQLAKVALEAHTFGNLGEKSDARRIKSFASACYILCDFEASPGKAREFLFSDRRSFIYEPSQAFRETQ